MNVLGTSVHSDRTGRPVPRSPDVLVRGRCRCATAVVGYSRDMPTRRPIRPFTVPTPPTLFDTAHRVVPRTRHGRSKIAFSTVVPAAAEASWRTSSSSSTPRCFASSAMTLSDTSIMDMRSSRHESDSRMKVS